jgi:hypothetical protein
MNITVTEIINFVYEQGQIDFSLGDELEQVVACVHICLVDLANERLINSDEIDEILKKVIDVLDTVD